MEIFRLLEHCRQSGRGGEARGLVGEGRGKVRSSLSVEENQSYPTNNQAGEKGS